jgi:chromosome partitioning protein
MDPQANASNGLGINTNTVASTIYEVLAGKIPIPNAMVPCEMPHLYVLPSHINLVGAEIELISMQDREYMLKNVLHSLADIYDFVIIDCPPSLGILTLNALTAAHSVLIPVQCEYYALEGLGQLLNTISIVKQHLNPLLDVEGILLTMYDSRLRLSNQVVQEVKKHFEDKVFNTLINRNVRLSESPSHGKPILLYDAFSSGALNYLELAKEILIKNGFIVPESN